MKKLAFLVLIILAVGFTALYYLIPDTLVVTEAAGINCVADAAFRSISDEQSWNKWWPINNDKNNPATTGKLFQVGKNQYTLTKKFINNFEITIASSKGPVSSEMNILTIPHDSSFIRWQVIIPAGSNPFRRIAAYYGALSLKKDMHTILDRLQSYLSDFKNVYGFSYHEASIKDTLLIITKSFSPDYPTTGFVYSLVNKLRDFNNKQGPSVTGIPMLNITKRTPSGYGVMVALPVNRPVQQKDSVSMIKMVPGKFIITDVTGGLKTVEQAHQQIQYYFQDYRRVSMAIPFEYLVTDRQKETDTSKWVTRIYSPVY